MNQGDRPRNKKCSTAVRSTRNTAQDKQTDIVAKKIDDSQALFSTLQWIG